MTHRDRGEDPRSLPAFEFEHLVARVAPHLLDTSSIVREPRLADGAQPDLVARLPDGGRVIIEAKAVTPGTPRRVREAANQLSYYAEQLRQAEQLDRAPLLILAVPGTLAPHLQQSLRQRGIDLWDGALLARALRRLGLRAEAERLAQPREDQLLSVREPAEELSARLRRVECGRANWATYQRLCGDILSFLFCPPLEQPISESANESKINRRDFVIPNYVSDGFWGFMRDKYAAEYIVVDAKNYCKGIEKDQVLQIANYLNRHGAGLFGVIISRGPSRSSAELTRREQWILHSKLILTLTDDDLQQMLSNKQAGADATDVVRQKIEDFRLGF
ncbi:hypothetical protein AB6N24_08880 [Cellulomonas sp. 179-A 4D5 NHS]|uniref:hypothetical protein n=1 Tax=Cellulomonas sp. 179-A 4D5 NHS TaxID=3142378 RepID=UPI0039A120DD